MCRALLLAGTTEGRLLAEFCATERIPAIVCVVSEYGRRLLPKSPYIKVVSGPLDQAGMEQVMAEHGVGLAVDATHPYAAMATRNLKAACESRQCRYIRCGRASVCLDRQGLGEEMLFFDSLEEASEYLSLTKGNILITTGSKELSPLTRIPDYRERLYVRVLPDERALACCRELGIWGRHLICMQGPFIQEMNEAMMRQYHIRYLVTKEAGNAGGFQEKIRAAERMGVKSLIIGRPPQEEGEELEHVKQALLPYADKRYKNEEYKDKENTKPQVFLVGIGMGGPDDMTVEAVKTLENCDAVLGADRMLQSVGRLTEGKLTARLYLGQDVMRWLGENKGFLRVAAVFSGDTGFFSGASKLMRLLEEEHYDYTVIPGISSVSYLSALSHTSWEDVFLASCHGRDFDVASALREHGKLFLLLGGGHDGRWLGGELVRGGFGNARIFAGERMSYPDERIWSGTAEELLREGFSSFLAVLVERP